MYGGLPIHHIQDPKIKVKYIRGVRFPKWLPMVPRELTEAEKQQVHVFMVNSAYLAIKEKIQILNELAGEESFVSQLQLLQDDF